MAAERGTPRWYEEAIVYQVPVALFQDSNGNGWGDLRGLTSRLDYIHDLGATAVWLQPFYRSPYVDGGYDVIDHLEVSDRFGTLADFEDLMAAARDLGLEVILDLVVQHTSTDHPWFREACRNRESPYRDYYVWSDEAGDAPVEPVFPTVEDSVWTWHEEAGQYYRHAFYSHEADLDVANPAVVGEIEKIMRFWLDLGIAGFRVDAVPYMVAQAAQGGDHAADDGHALLEHLRSIVTSVRPDGVLIAESDVAPEQYAEQFGHDGRRFAMLLDFWVNNHLFLALARGEAEPVRRALGSQPQPPAGCAYAIWLRNHDELDLEQLSPAERDEAMAVFAPHPQMRAFGRGIRRRLAPMLVDPRQRRLAIFLLCALPGTPILLYGDEIGMGDEIEMPDRAAVRTPMQWTEELNAGFSTCNPTELIHPVITTGAFRHQDVNVRQQLREPDSLLSTVHELFTARRSFGPFLASGCRTLELDQPSVLGLRHERVGCESLLLANLSPERTDAGLPEPLSGEWRQVAVDQQYDDDPAADRSQQAHLHGYGYRWWARER